jgi:hypothetical protein
MPTLHRQYTYRLVLGVLMITAAGCGGSGPKESTTTASVAESSGETTVPPVNSAEVTPIRVTFGDNVVHAEIWDNPTGRSLLDQLPLTVEFSDFNDAEKIADLDNPLTMSGMPAGDDPQPQDIGWYAPSENLVFYYRDVGYWDGIARIGRFTDDVAPIVEQDQDFTAVIDIDR